MPDAPNDRDQPRQPDAPQPIGLGDPNAADRQGDIAADDAGASAAVTASIGGVQGSDPENADEDAR